MSYSGWINSWGWSQSLLKSMATLQTMECTQWNAHLYSFQSTVSIFILRIISTVCTNIHKRNHLHYRYLWPDALNSVNFITLKRCTCLLTFMKVPLSHVVFGRSVLSFKGPICKNSEPVKYWCFEMVAGPTSNPNASVVIEMGMKLKNQLSYIFEF